MLKNLVIIRQIIKFVYCIIMGIKKFSYIRVGFLWLLLLAFLPSCSDSSAEPVPEEEVHQIIFLFSPGGLGDLSYNDCILSGVQQFKKENPEVDVFMYSPPSLEVAERIFTDWLKRPGSNIPVLFVLGSSDYESLADEYVPQYPLTPNKRLLLFESLTEISHEGISTFHVSMYGASLLAGKTAAECSGAMKSLVLLGSSTDIPIRSALHGFAEGLGADPDVEYLADDWSGYIMAPEAYRKMSGWASTYGFIFPVAGGSNAGLYRYSRENAVCPFLAGMDVDQSGFSQKITGSVVKHFDRLIVEYLTEWLHYGSMPKFVNYGLESGYVDWVLSPTYESRFRPIVEQSRKEAVEKEKIYYETSQP